VLAGDLVLLRVLVYGEGHIVLLGLGWPSLRGLSASPRRRLMATTIPSAVLVPVTPVFSNTERLALAGFLAGYSGLTRQAYELDLRQYAAWCQSHQLRRFAARRADIECFARDLEARGRARATITRQAGIDKRVGPHTLRHAFISSSGTPVCRCATCRKPRRTLTRAPPCATTGPAPPWTGMRRISSPPM
jgi:hypothetical protein